MISKTEMLTIVNHLNNMANDAYRERDDYVRITTREVYSLAYKIEMYVRGYARPCKNVSGCNDVFECSECRCKVEVIGECGNEYGELFHVPYMPVYCPSCGAKVVEK